MILVHVEGSLGFVCDTDANVMWVRFLSPNGNVVKQTVPSDNSTARSRACRARAKARKESHG